MISFQSLSSLLYVLTTKDRKLIKGWAWHGFYLHLYSIALRTLSLYPMIWTNMRGKKQQENLLIQKLHCIVKINGEVKAKSSIFFFIQQHLALYCFHPSSCYIRYLPSIDLPRPLVWICHGKLVSSTHCHSGWIVPAYEPGSINKPTLNILTRNHSNKK